MFGPEPVVSRVYELKKAGSVYVSDTGKRISPYLIENLLSSLTDLYESDQYEDTYDKFHRTCYYPHYKVTITLQDGTHIILESNSNYHCWIPWNITCNGKTYVQYNGEIPSAVLRLEAALRNKPEIFFAKYGCFPAPVPTRYKEKGISPDFPASTYDVTPEKLAGIPHVQWKMKIEDSMKVSSLFSLMTSPFFIEDNLVVLTRETVFVLHPKTGALVWRNHCGEIASKPLYENGTLFITTPDTVLALEFKTGKIKWQTRIPGELSIRGYLHDLLVYEDMLFVGVKGPSVYCFNVNTGNLIWEFCEEGPNYADLYIAESNLIVISSGVRVFDLETGGEIWKMLGDYYTKIRSCTLAGDDKILIEAYHIIDGSCSKLADIHSGDILWGKGSYSAGYLQYHNKRLYFSNSLHQRIVCMDARSMEEVWSYPYKNWIGGIKIIGDHIAFCEYIKKEDMEFVTRLVFLDLEGNFLWQQNYPEGEQYRFSFSLNIPFYGNKLFFIEYNTIEAINKNTGEHMWKAGIRGPYVSSFDIYKNTIYVTSKDSRLYCIDIDTGVIKWYYQLENEILYWDMNTVMDPEFNNNFIAVATLRGDVFMFSHYAKIKPFVPQKNGVYIE